MGRLQAQSSNLSQLSGQIQSLSEQNKQQIVLIEQLKGEVKERRRREEEEGRRREEEEGRRREMEEVEGRMREEGREMTAEIEVKFKKNY